MPKSKPYLSDELRPKVGAADILLVPNEGYAERPDLRFFPGGTADLFDFLKRKAPDAVLEVARARSTSIAAFAKRVSCDLTSSSISTSHLHPTCRNSSTRATAEPLAASSGNNDSPWSCNLRERMTNPQITERSRDVLADHCSFLVCDRLTCVRRLPSLCSR